MKTTRQPFGTDTPDVAGRLAGEVCTTTLEGSHQNAAGIATAGVHTRRT